MKKTLLTIAALVAVVGTGAANAGTEVGQWTVGAGGLYTATDSDRGLDDGASINVVGGYAMTEKWDFGLSLFAGNHDRNFVDPAWPGIYGKTTIKGVTFDFNRVFSRDARLSPYLLIGAGIIDQFRPNRVQDKEVTVKYGGGAVADLAEMSFGKLQVKVEGAARTAVGKSVTDFVGALSLQVAFGAGGN
jgi:hypothetical protein